ncbi:pyridoxal phosphate-dependent aminotransferase [Halovivax limisalsi]|uniref:pyridoxal phosphate-dependent aminotransferase n=1 Tax=Halovivax limisalsi TaxID=1453760 RepID=UPI001FFD2521|nr:pyridoxal phosphate-dependent aminotransferase [Halovivax limisalsi]
MQATLRTRRTAPSATLSISELAATVEADGHDVIDLSLGQPDFPTPEHIVAAGKAAMDDGHTGYPPAQGIEPLRDAIADRLREDGIARDPDEIIVTPGAKQAVFEAVQTLVDPGDEVVLLDPAWVSYEPMVSLAGGSTTHVDLTGHDFQLEPALEALGDAVSDETAVIILNSPCNPSGAVFSRRALSGVRDLAVDHDVSIISDEIYDRITYDVEPVSPASLDGLADRTVTVNGFSKSYSMTGWRLGYLCAPDSIVTEAMKVQAHSVSCAPNFVQHAGVEALRGDDDAIAEMRATLRERRNVIVDAFAEHGVDIAAPDGAFYLLVPTQGHDEWAETALREAHVATVPGSAFGTPEYARLSYANSADRLAEAVDRLAGAGLLD